jgi:hypothetical protein
MIHIDTLMRHSSAPFLTEVEDHCNDILRESEATIISVVPVVDSGHEFANIAYITWSDGERPRRGYR